MRFLFYLLFAALVFAIGPVAASARDRVTSAKSASDFLTQAGQQFHLANENHPGAYYCGDAVRKGDFYVIALHRTDETAPKDWVGSSLVGYYGIRVKDGSIVEWDVVADRPGNLIGTKDRAKLSSDPTTKDHTATD